MTAVPVVRIALVTGGSGQLGRHVVERLIEDGVKTHVPILDATEVTAVNELLGDRSREVSFHMGADLTDAAVVGGIVRAVEAQEGRAPNVLLNLDETVTRE